jgi:hypothetical protein
MAYREEAHEYAEDIGIQHAHEELSSYLNETGSLEPIYYINDRDEKVIDPGPGPYMVRLLEIALLQYTLRYC